MLAGVPLLIPRDAQISRFFAALLVVICFMKLWDLTVDLARGRPANLPARIANSFALVSRREGAESQPSPAEDRRRLQGSLAGMLLAFAAVALSYGIDWTRWPFLIEHGLKATAFFLAAVAGFQVTVATCRLRGAYVVRFGEAPLDAMTPADFWRRYNRVTGEFLHYDVFAPFNGRRHPVRATLIAFGVSGLIHEYLFSVSVGRLQGLQLSFFLIQGLATALTLGIKPHGSSARAWQAGTFLFNLLASVIFFLSAHEIVPIYQDVPSWLEDLAGFTRR